MAELRDVTLRDGLQLTGKLLPLHKKVSLARRLLAAGVPSLEIGSLARPDLVPPLADTLDLVRALEAEELQRCWLWVATPRHVERALAAGARNLQYCLSVSPAHNRANIGRDTETSVAAMPAAVEMVSSEGGRIQLCLATAFSCPFDGPVDRRHVLDIVTDPRTEGATDVVLCDTLGQAVPSEVRELVGQVRREGPPRRIVFHGHDTWGQGVANSLAAIEAGAAVVDGALGGLGGCPFAPGASGNTATEDLLFALRPDWLTPASLAGIVELTEDLLTELGEPNRSRASQGVRSAAKAFPWTRGPRDTVAPPVEIDSLADAGAFALSDERLARLLDEQFECTFCWTNRDGDPVALTESFIHAEGCFWLCAEESRVRVKAIRRDPRSALVISSLGTALGQAKTVSFKGTSEVVRDRDRILWFLAEIARRYDPNDEQAQAAHVRAADHPGRVVIKFVPTKLTNAFDGTRARRRKD